MAILSKIRQRTVFLIVIIAMALFAFVLADVIKNGGASSSKDQSRVATINGEDIDRDAFMSKVDAQQRLQPNSQGNAVMNQVYNQEVRRVLMEEQYEKLGLRVEEAQLNNALADGLAGNPQFQNEAGLFDAIKMQEYIADAKLQADKGDPAAWNSWNNYERSVESRLLNTMYMNMIKGGLKSTLAEGEQLYRFENDKINFQYVRVPFTSIKDDEVAVSESEIKSYVDTHKNDFEVDAQTDIEYVAFNEAASQADIDAAMADVALLNTDRKDRGENIVSFKNAVDSEAYVNEYSDVSYQDRWFFKNQAPAAIADTVFKMNVGDVYGPYKEGNNYNLTKVIEKKQLPDSVQSNHILVRWAGTFRASSDVVRTEPDAQKLADSLLAVIKRTPSKFGELAGQFSDDASNKDKEGDLGFYGPGQLAPEFNDYIFDNNEGSIGIAKTVFGYHIIKVGEKKNVQTALKLATITKEIEASDATINDVFSKSSKFEVAARKGDLSQVAIDQNLEVRPVNKIGNLDANLPGLPNSRSIISWSFNEDTNVGDVKRFKTDNGYVVARVTRKSEKGVQSVADASATVTPILRNKKKAEMIRAKMTGTDLQAIATANSVSVQTASAVTMSAPTVAGAGQEPKVVGAAFGKEANETTDLITGKTGVFMVKVLSKTAAPELNNYASFANQLNTQTAPAVDTRVFNALKNAAEIDDNRALFY